MKSFFRSAIALLLLLTLAVETVQSQVGWTKSYERAAVVTAERHASEIGREILRSGGNAVDAAVAVQFALAVTLPRAGNIGGGGFMVIHLADGTDTALDYREKAPLGAGPDMYLRDGEYIPELSREGALAVGVPGVVDGMVRALQRHGRLPLEMVMAPAVKLAREGYRLSLTQAEDLNNHADAFRNYAASEEYFTRSDGRPWREGDLFVQEDLARTLERIARQGREGFYAGETAEMIVREMEKQEGLITRRDLREYRSVWREPVTAEWNGYRLHVMPPPSSGSIAIAQILTMLEPYDLQDMGFNSARYVHLLTETMRRAFADRSYFLGDPDYVDIPRQELLSEEYNRGRMASYDPDAATSSNEIGHGEVAGFEESRETTHFSVVDSAGNAVGVTTTLNGSFGSHVSVGGAGFALNNEMDDFTAKPGEPNMFGLIQGEANAVEPGKRMLSSMSPTVVTRGGQVRAVLGAAGGPRIITATLQSFLNMAVFGMNAQEAISAPRFHHQWLPDNLYYEEYGLSPDTREILLGMGHNLQATGGVGRGHIIWVDGEGRRHGAADPRGDGYTMGY
ncbi:MAG: gamma-glutamyltransferase [Balneolaceae bacterium]|nr:gamma-glutamyltransferase [Balneolaceae bacterium]